MQHVRLKLSAVLLLVLGMTGLKAQEAIPASGGNASGSGGTVSYSIGQVVYQTLTGTNGWMIEGLQQPYEISAVTGLEEAVGINLSVTAYPNPVTDHLTLTVENFEFTTLTYQLYDSKGLLIVNKNIEAGETNIGMGNLVPSTYFLKVMQNNEEIKTFKIIKK